MLVMGVSLLAPVFGALIPALHGTHTCCMRA